MRVAETELGVLGLAVCSDNFEPGQIPEQFDAPDLCVADVQKRRLETRVGWTNGGT